LSPPPFGSPLCIWFYRLRAFAPRREWVERQLWNCTGDLGLRAPRKPLIRQISRLVLARIIEKLSAQRVHSHTTRSKGDRGAPRILQPQSGSSKLRFYSQKASSGGA